MTPMPPSQPTWPPPPDLPHPLAGHNTFLTACIIETPAKMPLSRLRLVMLLRKETGWDLRECKAFVDYYCDRQAILMPMRGLMVWFGCLPPVIALTALSAMWGTWFILDRRLDAAATHLERVAIHHERTYLDLVFLGVTLIASCVNVIVLLDRSKQTQRDAAEAREKVVLRKSIVGILQEAARTRLISSGLFTENLL